MRIEKYLAAIHQLDAAIQEYHRGHIVCAITLAGAAEEILGDICKRRGLKNALTSATESREFTGLYPKSKDRRDLLNQTKNALKHAERDDEDFIEIDEHDTYLIIARAIYNLKLLKLEQSPLVRGFCEIHKPSTTSPRN